MYYKEIVYPYYYLYSVSTHYRFYWRNYLVTKLESLEKEGMSISHLLFVDDFKTSASDEKGAKLQLDLMSRFTRDISLQLGRGKFSNLNIERDNQKSLGKFLTLDETNLAELTKANVINT